MTVAEDNGFAALGLPKQLVARLARDGITAPFPIQVATIPDAMAGKDVLGRGQTGSGKTLAFGLPTLSRLAAGTPAAARKPKALIMSPTRELAMQISDALEPLVHVLGLRHKLVAGGMPYQPQLSALDRGVDLLIATPGRLNDLIERGAVGPGRLHDRHPRRGRPHGRDGLPARDHGDPRPDPRGRAAAALLGDPGPGHRRSWSRATSRTP